MKLAGPGPRLLAWRVLTKQSFTGLEHVVGDKLL